MTHYRPSSQSSLDVLASPTPPHRLRRAVAGRRAVITTPVHQHCIAVSIDTFEWDIVDMMLLHMCQQGLVLVGARVLGALSERLLFPGYSLFMSSTLATPCS